MYFDSLFVVLRRYCLLAFFYLLLVIALLIRLWLLQDLSARVLECRFCVVLGVLKADLPLLAALGACFLSSCLMVRRWWSLPLRCLAVGGLLLYVADMVVMSQFFTRLMWADVRIYLGQPNIVWRHLSTFPWPYLAGGGILLAGLVACCVKKPRTTLPWREGLISIAAFAVLGMSSHYAIPAPSYVHDWAIRNVIVANMPTGISRDYSRQTRDRWLQEGLPADARQCVSGRNQKDDIVLLILESWSAYHSNYWSGFNDWTPRLDRIARQGINFTRFHAGGFNTNEGLVSLLAGKEFTLPIMPLRQVKPFETAWNLTSTLPGRLAEHGYHTAFLTSGNLGFTGKGDWLDSLGFDYREGHDYPGYEGISRHHFDAVPDDVLYARALDYIKAQRGEAWPSFLVIENVSTHHPYIHPYTEERSQEAVFRYMDATAADFIEALRTQGFFENGLLIVISDHRAMTMVSAKESQQLGRAASSRVPAFIATGNEEERRVDTLFHQADLMPTLLTHVSDTYCHAGPVRDMLSPEKNQPRCVMHARGDRRDRVDVFCEEGEGTVKVNGEDSRFVGVDGLGETHQRRLLERIAHERIRADMVME